MNGDIHRYTDTIVIEVIGTPRGAGSKRGFAIKRKDGSLGVAMADSTGELGRDWRGAVIAAARQVVHGTLAGAFAVDTSFRFARPKSHYRGGNRGLRPDSPLLHVQKPDADKLRRAVIDALTAALIWADDCLVVCGWNSKAWCRDGELPGVTIRINRLTAMPVGLAGSPAAFVVQTWGYLPTGVETP